MAPTAGPRCRTYSTTLNSSAEDFSRIAAVAAASGYITAELHDIYLYEVAPVVYLNYWKSRT